MLPSTITLPGPKRLAAALGRVADDARMAALLATRLAFDIVAPRPQPVPVRVASNRGKR